MSGDLLFWAMACLATFLVGASKGGLPGVGILSVPVLSQVMPPVMAAGLLLPIYVLSDLYGLWLYRKEFNSRVIVIVTCAATLGILIGWATARFNNDSLVRLIVGVVGLWYIVDIVMKRNRPQPEPKTADVPRGIFWGTIAGFTSFVAHAGGTAYQMYVLPQRMEKMIYAGTATITFTFINLLKLPPYWMLGQISPGSLWYCLALAPISLVGAWSGYQITRKVTGQLFFRLVELALFLVSLKMMYDGVSGLMQSA
jgi:uncharacterized protein